MHFEQATMHFWEAEVTKVLSEQIYRFFCEYRIYCEEAVTQLDWGHHTVEV